MRLRQGVSGTVYEPKDLSNHESQKSKFHLSFRVMISMWSAVFLVLFLRKEKSGKRVSEKTAKWQKGKERLKQIATYRPS